MKEILFVCTGNYYRSRFAEIIFNHLAQRESVPLIAFSRGFRLNPAKNTGVISPHALSYLAELNLSPADPGTAVSLAHHDLDRAHIVIVLDEKEHRPMMQQSFPEWQDRVIYWSFEDDYLVSPNEVLPALKERVEQFFLEIQQSHNRARRIG